MSGPLTGIKVVEISMFQQGPVAGMRLGDLGAEVIKVEPKSGDPGRGFMKIITAMTGREGRNYYFEHCNRNKRGMVIDLKSPQGLEILFKLLETADVFLNNLSIDAPKRMGIAPDTILERYPRLIYAQASGWGRQGPDAESLSFDYTGIARSGLMMACGERGAPPIQMLPGIGDEIGGLICAWAITAALFARDRTGKGQLVDTSLMSGTIAALGFILAAPAVWGQEFPRGVRAEAGNPLYNHYRCQDDKWLAIAHLDPDRYWPKLCQALGRPELVEDERFGSIKARSANAQALVAIFDECFAQKTRGEWIEILGAHSCIFTPIQSPTEVIQDPQALANDYIIQAEHPEYGLLKMVGFPWSFSETPASYRRPAPGFGQHTDEILGELNFTEEEIRAFRENGIVV